jgi:hypothetical protein
MGSLFVVRENFSDVEKFPGFRCQKIPRSPYLIRCPFLSTFNGRIKLWYILDDLNFSIRGKFSDIEKFPDLLTLSFLSPVVQV